MDAGTVMFKIGDIVRFREPSMYRDVFVVTSDLYYSPKMESRVIDIKLYLGFQEGCIREKIYQSMNCSVWKK